MEKQLLSPDDFIQEVTTDIDSHFDELDYERFWTPKNLDDAESVKETVINRLRIGYRNEIFVRNAAWYALQAAPSLKSQQALLKQVEDEHKHAIWIADILKKRGYNPEEAGTTRTWSIFWNYIFARGRDFNNFLSNVATTQLVLERLTGLRATETLANAIADHDPEVSSLYGDKIRRDEIFHVIQLPEALLQEHATTLESQEVVRDGVERGKLFLKWIGEELQHGAQFIKPELI